MSAHTAMLTISLEDVIKDPTAVLTSILNFVWREDWEWEGRGGMAINQQQQEKSHEGSWQKEANDLIDNEDMNDNDNSHYYLKRMLEQTTLLLEETTSTVQDDGKKSFQKAMQGAFSSEMKRSSDMTSWPCPSFWEGISSSSAGDDANDDSVATGNDGERFQMHILQRISKEMVPNCNDEDPFVRCTVNRDRCEVKQDAKCK